MTYSWLNEDGDTITVWGTHHPEATASAALQAWASSFPGEPFPGAERYANLWGSPELLDMESWPDGSMSDDETPEHTMPFTVIVLEDYYIDW